MRQFFFLLVISALVALSSLARAQAEHQIPVYFEVTSFNPQNLLVTVSGTLPNQCTVDPQPTLFFEDGVLIVDIVARQTSDYCVHILGKEYSKAFDIGSLRASLSELGLNPNGVYPVRTADGSLDLTVDFGTFYHVQPFASVVAAEALAPVNEKQTVFFAADDVFSK